MKLGPETSLIEIKGLEADTVYKIRVRSVALSGYSDYTDALEIETHSAGEKCFH